VSLEVAATLASPEEARDRHAIADVRDVRPDLQAVRLAADVHGTKKHEARWRVVGLLRSCMGYPVGRPRKKEKKEKNMRGGIVPIVIIVLIVLAVLYFVRR
jgi:hypothetical protein